MYQMYELPKWAISLLLIILVIGFTSRIIRLFDLDSRLLQQFVTEQNTNVQVIFS